MFGSSGAGAQYAPSPGGPPLQMRAPPGWSPGMLAPPQMQVPQPGGPGIGGNPAQQLPSGMPPQYAAQYAALLEAGGSASMMPLGGMMPPGQPRGMVPHPGFAAMPQGMLPPGMTFSQAYPGAAPGPSPGSSPMMMMMPPQPQYAAAGQLQPNGPGAGSTPGSHSPGRGHSGSGPQPLAPAVQPYQSPAQVSMTPQVVPAE